jgi:hypothetical protein
MPDQQPKPDKTLSEISHLFLSSVRERQMQGAPRPVRTPPGQQQPDGHGSAPAHADLDIDLTPEEFAQVLGVPEPAPGAEESHVPAAALLAGHLGASQLDRARDYAAYHASGGARVGLIEIDASEFRLWLFEPSNRLNESDPVQATSDSLDARRMTEALHELAHDVDQWFVLLPATRGNEARALLRDLDRWVLLASRDHDGIVAGYRTLKGLSESHERNESAGRALPRLSLAVLDARDPAEASRVFSKLAAVCQQFLHWPVEAEPLVTRATGVAEHLVLACRATRDKAQLAAAPQWQVVQNFLKHLRTMPREDAPAERTVSMDSLDSVPSTAPTPDVRSVAQSFVSRQSSSNLDAGAERGAAPDPAMGRGDPGDVIDLPSGDTDPASIVRAVLRGGADMIECPIRPPMCPHASLAVSRERRLVLVGVARQGLSDLRAIGQAYRWLIENRPLISLAVPQFAIDAHQLPRLHLLVDHADVTADVLQPMLQSANVTVHAYRKLRWGGKTGLLLEAA